jgi:hypothetical protein
VPRPRAAPQTVAPAAARLTIESDPAGARVIVEGEVRCKTPCTLDGLSATVPLVIGVEREGYLPWSTLVDLGQVAQARRQAKLRREPGPGARWGKVLVKASAPAEVLVNGAPIGHVTSTGPLALPAGPTELTMVTASGVTTRRVTVEVPPGATVEAAVSLP